MNDEDFQRWFRRFFPFPGPRGFRSWFDEDVERMMKNMEEMMAESFKETAKIPKGLVRERKLPDGSTVREMGPFVYGYSLTIGPDKKPIIREFGNVKPSAKLLPGAPPYELKEEREPLIDVVTEDGHVKVIAELPGVEKTDIKIHATENNLEISVDTERRRYRKVIDLPAEIIPDSAKATYKNGVLEVSMERTKPEKAKGQPVKVD